MLRRYLGAVIIALLVVIWLATVAHGWLHLNTTVKWAQSVARGTHTLRQELEHPRVDLVAEHAFPEGRIVDVVKSAWSGSIKAGPYPSDVVAAPTVSLERSRSR